VRSLKFSTPYVFTKNANTNKIKINPNKHGLEEEYEISTPNVP
jgi:hypothetical protein